MGKVLLTGASGFLASEVLKQLVGRGHRIVATVRTQDKADWIKEQHPKADINIEFVKDIQAPTAFDSVFQNNDIISVIHTASPFFRAKQDPLNELLNPAIKGTTNILHSINRVAPQVKHVVVTSSYVAIMQCDPTPDMVYTEKTWNDMSWNDAIDNIKYAYRGSKTFAEKALWDFIEKENAKFNATAITPPIIHGPCHQRVDSPAQLNTSSKTIYRLLHSSAGAIERPSGGYDPWVDSRDAALAHIMAIEKPNVSAGKRWFPTPGYYHAQDVLDVINEDFPQLRGKLAIGRPIDAIERKEALAKLPKIDNSRTNQETGIKYHPFRETIFDTVSTLLRLDEKWGSSL